MEYRLSKVYTPARDIIDSTKLGNVALTFRSKANVKKYLDHALYWEYNPNDVNIY